MADPSTRKNQQMKRLRHRLKKKQEALADLFDFKIFVAFVFKDRKKGSALFEASEIVPIMANNYEDKIMKGVDRNIYSMESSQEMLGKDVVQLYVARYASMRKDVLGTAKDVDFLLWPRGDLLCIRCFVFSRWKVEGKKNGDPYRVVQADFMFFSSDYEFQLQQLLPTSEEQPTTALDQTRSESSTLPAGDDDEENPQATVVRNGEHKKTPGSILRSGKDLILNNREQSMFLFVNRFTQPQNPSRPAIFQLHGLCLNLPQEVLTCWGLGSIDDVLEPFV